MEPLQQEQIAKEFHSQKSGITVWTDISYTNANASAKKLYNNSNVKSGLLTGTMWDATCKWINCETDASSNVLHSVTDSISWGNYSDTTGAAQYDTDGTTKISGSKQTAGKSENWKAKNIYDFAGNVWEWTNEATSTYHVLRGGFCSYSGNSSWYPASYRDYNAFFDTYDLLGFRLSLYIM